MKFRRIKIDRLFHGFASIRDYIVKDAKKYNYGLVLEWQNRKMTLIPEKLQYGFENSDIFESKQIPGQKYKLIDYDWKDDKIGVQNSLW